MIRVMRGHGTQPQTMETNHIGIMMLPGILLSKVANRYIVELGRRTDARGSIHMDEDLAGCQSLALHQVEKATDTYHTYVILIVKT